MAQFGRRHGLVDSGVKTLIDFGSVVPTGALRAERDNVEHCVHALYLGRHADEAQVALGECLLLFVVQPVAGAASYLGHCLGIELRIVDVLFHLDVARHVGAEVAA